MKRKTFITIAGVTLFVLLIISSGAMADVDPCLSPANPVVAENCLTGNDPSEWDISGAGDLSIQGFATDISVDQGETVSFKIKTDATSYHIDIYRLGYYGGMGARKVAGPINVLSPPSQPACLSDTGTGLLDCGNWTESASWPVPVNATSGIYLAKLVRDDGTPGASHIVFIVRDDNGGSDILFQTSDTTWQAYNRYGGNSLYTGSASNPPVGRAHKVSYNRPFTTRDAPTEDWLFNAEYPMVRWLERNGYDVSYFTDVDTDRLGTELLEHKVFLSVGHDEYWSAAQRANVEAARNAGVHLGFFSGNEIYWKVRWENSVDGSNTPYRTLVCYKEGTLGEINCGGKCDPLPNVWTGLWRDGCPPTYAPNDGCRPENELSGQISWVGSTGAIVVPEAYSNHPFWRNTTIADLLPGQSATLASGTLGYEWNPYQAQYGSFYPPGIVWLSNTSLSGQTHHLSLYQHASGAKVFGAGTVQWSWGLDSNHDRGSSPEDVRMQQATVNLLGLMGVQPTTLQLNLVQFVPCVPDCTGRVCGDDGCGGSCGSCTPGVTTCNALGQCVACDPNRCAGRECGDDNCGGTCGTCPPTETCQEATGMCEPPSCPCSLWNDSTMPADVTHGDTHAIEVGVRFQTEVDGYITGIRFYKTSLNNGAHVGHLWANDGTLLGTVTFAGETASGWQEAMFDSPIPVTANTTYVASYNTPVGQYAIDEYYFAKENDFITFPLRALADGVAGGSNGIYVYSATPAFPTATWHASNYWVDVVFDVTAVDLQPPTVLTRTPSAGASGVSTTTTVRATFSEPVQQATITFELRDPGSNLVPSTVSYDAPTRTASLSPNAELNASTSYTATVSGVRDLAGNIMTAPNTWSFTTGAPPPPPPDEGPGGPILVIASSSNPFTRYYAEILRAEGLNYFTVTDISLVTQAVLDQHEVVILGEMSLSAAQVTLFTNWVNAGGNLIAMRPDKQLAGLLGLTRRWIDTLKCLSVGEHSLWPWRRDR